MVALTVQARPTAVDLAARGAVVAIVSDGLAAPRVDLRVPADLAGIVREALGWRMAAMRAQAGGQTDLGGARKVTLVAVPGCSGETGWCSSCGDPHATRHQGGDCTLCHAARIGVLRSLGRVPPAAPLEASPRRTLAEWQADISLAPFAGGGLPLPAPAAPWTCRACDELVDGYRPTDDVCGRCELHQIKVGLGQAIGTRKGRPL